jgi:serine O-acetyltransferase
MQSAPLVLRAGTPGALANYVATQLNYLFPDEGLAADRALVAALVPAALERMRPILAAVRNFTPGRFDHFHSLQYATFLYLLGNEEWRARGGSAIADRLYGLNRALNSLDLFHSVCMPEIFFLSHALGAVLGNATYGTDLIVFQNATIGRVGDARPEIGTRVVLYPGAQVTGAARIGDACVIGAGVHLHGATVPPDSLVMLDAEGRQVVCRRTKDYAGHYFRHPGE